MDTHYEVNEGDGLATMAIGVVTDAINFEVSLSISLSNDTATGM